MPSSDDRRRSPRLRIAACAAIETLGRRNEGNQALGTVRDVSATGIGLETGQPPLPNQEVYLRIALNDEIEEVPARTTRIRRVDSSNFYEVGLDWGACTAEQMAFLERVFEAAGELQF